MPQLVTVIAGFLTQAGLGAAAAGWLASFAVNMFLSIGFSALSAALRGKPKVTEPGIRSNATLTGGTDPMAFVIGRYATGGQLVTPPMAHGKVGKTPNAYLTYVIALSDLPGVQLRRLFIDGQPTTIGGPPHPEYGAPVTFRGSPGYVWIKFYDGFQTSADPMLLAKYGSHPQRPWKSDMVGTGVAYAILTFRFERTLFKSYPGVRFELDGIPLYDPRKDPSVGGVGTQSWSNPSTWATTANPAVIAYNIYRGISVPGGDTWGGGWTAADLPVANWVAAMNAADAPVALSGGGTEPAYRAGYEVKVDDEPGDVIAELLKTCAGRVADVGGTEKIAVGAPAMPVKAITDDDIIVTDEQTNALFPSLASTHNGVHATFPDPASLWESRDAPPRYDPVAEAMDGRRLVGNVQLSACPFANQVQRLMQAWINEERRFRRHQLMLPPDAAILEPFDVISWSSARNGYSAKTFEVVEVIHDPVSLLQLVSLREVDPADYNWNSTLELPWVAPVPGTSLPDPQVVPLFDATGVSLDDAYGVPRRPAIILTWDGSEQDDVSALQYEIRLQGGTQVLSGATLDVASGSHVVTAGIMSDMIYEARAQFVAPRPVQWTGWVTATTPPVNLTLADVTGLDQLFDQMGIAAPHILPTKPVSNPNGWSVIFVLADKKLYRWDDTITEWVSTVDGIDVADGALSDTHFAVGSINADRLLVGTITTALLAAAAVKAQNMQIDGTLILDAVAAGFAMGKSSAADFGPSGIYMGRALKADGSLGYGFLMGTTIAGVSRYLLSSEDTGLQSVNIDHFLLSPLSSGNNSYTASQTVVLGVGTKSVNIDLLGGGGAGSGFSGAAGAAGGNTVVQLYDGATYSGISWTATGGAGGAGATTGTPTAGQNSAYGVGGIAGRSSYVGGRNGDSLYPAVPAGNASGYGAGGGGYGQGSQQRPGGWGGRGGSAGQQRTFLNVDVSALTDPRLVITIGAGGAAGAAGSGSAGLVKVSTFSSGLVQAGVVPLYPTATGQFSKTASQSGPTIFPDLGAGLWVISNGTDGSTLKMNVLLKPGGASLNNWNATSLTFVTDGRPSVSSSDASAITYNYQFYKMKV